MMTILLLIQLARAECLGQVTIEAWSAQLDTLRESATFGDVGTDSELDALVERTSCVNGPIPNIDLGSIWLAYGAWSMISGQPVPGGPALYFRDAKAISGDAVWDANYGTTVKASFDQVQVVGPLASLTILQVYNDLTIDGIERGGQGPFELPAGKHLIQWTKGGDWHGEWITLERGELRTFGPANVDDESENAPSETSSGRRRGEPPIDAPSQADWIVAVQAGVVGLGARGTLVNSTKLVLPYSGRDGAPLLSLSLSYHRKSWWLGVEGRGSTTPTLSDIPGPMALGVCGGISNFKAGEEHMWEFQIGVGAEILRLPVPELPGELTVGWEPKFRDNPAAPTGVALIRTRIGGDVGALVQAKGQGGPDVGSGELGLGMSVRTLDSIEFITLVSAGGMTAPAADDRFGWWTVNGGVRWSR